MKKSIYPSQNGWIQKIPKVQWVDLGLVKKDDAEGILPWILAISTLTDDQFEKNSTMFLGHPSFKQAHVREVKEDRKLEIVLFYQKNGWRYTYPSEKWWSSSVGMMAFPIWWESHSKFHGSSHHQPRKKSQGEPHGLTGPTVLLGMGDAPKLWCSNGQDFKKCIRSIFWCWLVLLTILKHMSSSMGRMTSQIWNGK